MAEESRTGAYTHGYGEGTVQTMASRSAGRQGAFFLPYLQAGMRLIDVGCGPGTITVGLATAVAPGEVLGIDVSPEMVEQARALAKEQGLTNVRFEVGRAEKLPVADETFDAAFEHTLLEHVGDPLQVLREMRRALKPGGVIGLADGDWGTKIVEPAIPEMLEGLALYERVWRLNGGNARFGRHQRTLMRQAGLRYGETTLRADSFSPGFAETAIASLLKPAVADRAIELGWTDRPTIESYVAGLRTWAKQPDALWITAVLQTVGWRD